MKIRSYKGSSLEQLYETIRRELGPEAIVISARADVGKKSLLNPLFKTKVHELIAVVDDRDGDQHLLQTMGRDGINEISEMQVRKWRDMEKTINELREEMRGMAGNVVTSNSSGLPDFAADWDPRFVQALRKMNADIFSDNMRPVLREGVKSILPIADDFKLTSESGPHVMVFVGPTGSGKTTTLAKMAARACLEKKLKVACITTDTFRVAAVDQIKEYCTLLGIELAVAFSAAEAAAAVKRFSDRDIIFVDTPGRNHYDQLGLSGIRGILQGMGPVTVMMHVPASLDRRNTRELLRNFQMLHPNYLVMTKSDETQHHAVLTTLASADCPLAFVTDGQRVPQDIQAAGADRLADLLVPAAGECDDQAATANLPSVEAAIAGDD